MTASLAKFVRKTKLHKRTRWHNQGGDSWHRHREPRKMIKTRDLQVVKTWGDLRGKQLELKRKIWRERKASGRAKKRKNERPPGSVDPGGGQVLGQGDGLPGD